MKRFILLFVCLFAFNTQANAFEPFGKFPVIQGPSSQTETQVAVLLDKGELIDPIIYEEGDKKEYLPEEMSLHYIKHTDKTVLVAYFKDLPKSETWILRLSAEERVVDTRILQSVDTDADSFRFALVSCSKDSAQHMYPKVWENLVGFKPDALFYIGDTVYVDNKWSYLFGVRERMIPNRHVEARETFTLFRLRELVPVYAIWDDHDYGKNNTDHKFEMKDFSLGVFTKFFPQRKIHGMNLGPGVAKSVKIGRQKIIMLEGRYYRNMERTIFFEGKSIQIKSMVGEQQWGWLMNELNDQSVDAVWLASGSQYYGGYRGFWGESYESEFPEEFKLLKEEIQRSGKTVTMLSGDIHATELMEIEAAQMGYKTFEFTSSGIIRPKYSEDYWENKLNPRRIEAFMAGPNYGIVDASYSDDEGLKTRIRAVTLDQKVVYDREITIRK